MVARRDFAGGAAATTLAADINATATTIIIAAASGWPSGTNGEFYICIDRGHAGEEKCLVQSRSGTTLTLVSTAKRGVDGTSASSHTAGVTVEHCLAAADLDESNNFVANPGVVGNIAASAPGDTAAAGTTGKWADAGHRHAREAAVSTTAYPHGVLYRSSDLTAGSASGDVTGMTAIAVTGDGVRRVRITVHMPYITNSTTGTTATIALMEGATTIATLAIVTGPTAWQLHTSYDLVPTTGAHTYKINIAQAGGTVSMGGGANVKSYVMAEDIGT